MLIGFVTDLMRYVNNGEDLRLEVPSVGVFLIFPSNSDDLKRSMCRMKGNPGLVHRRVGSKTDGTT